MKVVSNSQGIKAHKAFVACIEKTVLPGTGLTSDVFWSTLSSVLSEFTDRNVELLKIRDVLQGQIDSWYQKGCPTDQVEFLRKIGYLVDVPSTLSISTRNLDLEVSNVAAPQLVVPVDNSRFVVNAVNSRWGSLSSAVSSTDVIGKNPSAQAVHAYMLSFLDASFPLLNAESWKNVARLHVTHLGDSRSLLIELENGKNSGLVNPQLWTGWSLNQILLVHNGLHVIVKTLPGKHSIVDVILESALTAILDLEDSVAAVDAEDKSTAYSNWANVMRAEISVNLPNGTVRKLESDKSFRRPNGSILTLPGRVLSLVRNVGIHCKTNIVQTANGAEVFEGLIDAVVTIVAALIDIRSIGKNSKNGSIYIVKPKLHGPDEVQFACDVFGKIEQLLNLPVNTVKIGIMDEERRTSVNLRACINVAKQRVFFINTGFLDRTGDEIHTCMYGGPILPKPLIKSEPWINAYEQLNVLEGAICGFFGTTSAQVGKGMWAEPDSMAAMVKAKISHPLSGASTAWVPSPTAATLHAIHYHQVCVVAIQRSLRVSESVYQDLRKTLLQPPIMAKNFNLSETQISDELDNNAQGVLGYVVRWIDQGIGCSKVPDIRNIGLMEDLATLRISSQHIANWLFHKIITSMQVLNSFKKMAKHVDGQNSKDPKYQPMGPNFESNIAFQVALALVNQGTRLPNGYSIDLLIEGRRRVKSLQKNKLQNASL